jgi:hypothetical protein
MEAIWKSSNDRIHLRPRLDFSRGPIPKDPKAQPRARPQTAPPTRADRAAPMSPAAPKVLRREDLPPLPLERLQKLNLDAEPVRPRSKGHLRGHPRSLSPERRVDCLVSDGVVLTLLDGSLRIRPNSHHGYRSTEACMTYWNAFHAHRENRVARYIR